jgi:hypothetical protein
VAITMYRSDSIYDKQGPYERESSQSRESFRRQSSDFRFVVGVIVVATALIVVSIALGVEISPDASMLIGP